jgi:beta-glucosidase
LSGTPKIKRVDKNIDFRWGNDGPDGMNDDLFSVRWTGFIKAPESAEYLIGTVSDDGVRLWIDDKLVMEDWSNHSDLTKYITMNLEKGKLYKIKMEYYENSGGATAVLGWKTKGGNLLNVAVELARNSDYVIVFAGTSSAIETEGQDRDDLLLPAMQDELISEIANVNKNVIVVLTTGSPVLMDKWINKVSGVLQMWFAGSEGGNAVADIILGKYNPSGKLPITFPHKWEDCSAFQTYKTMNARTYYADDIYVGYRHFDKYNIDPLFPFGFGLSYTTFEYSNLTVTENSGEFNFTFEIKNSGSVKGEEVSQLYVSLKVPGVDMPVKELKGFNKVMLDRVNHKKFLSD